MPGWKHTGIITALRIISAAWGKSNTSFNTPAQKPYPRKWSYTRSAKPLKNTPLHSGSAGKKVLKKSSWTWQSPLSMIAIDFRPGPGEVRWAIYQPSTSKAIKNPLLLNPTRSKYGCAWNISLSQPCSFLSGRVKNASDWISEATKVKTRLPNRITVPLKFQRRHGDSWGIAGCGIEEPTRMENIAKKSG